MRIMMAMTMMMVAMTQLTLAMMTTMILLVTVMVGTDAQDDITCTAVTTRLSTSVTCHFGEDLNNTRHGFNVHYYPPSSDHPEIPLMCTFDEFSSLQCQNGPGVSFDRVVSAEVSFTIAPSVDKVGGHYVCQLVSERSNRKSQVCPLTLQDNQDEGIAVPSYISAADTSARDQGPEDDSSWAIVVYVLFFFVIVAIVCVIVVCVVIYIKRQRVAAWVARYMMGIKRPQPPQHEHRPEGRPSAAMIPGGWPSYFYNLGWEERDEKDRIPVDTKMDQSTDTAGIEVASIESESLDPSLPTRSSKRWTRFSLRLPVSRLNGGKRKHSSLDTRGSGVPEEHPMLEMTALPPQTASNDAHQKLIAEMDLRAEEILGDAEKRATLKEQKAEEQPDWKKFRASAKAKAIRKEARAKVKQETERKVKEITEQAKRDAKQMVKDAKGRPREELADTEVVARGIMENAQALASQMKQVAHQAKNKSKLASI